MTLVVIRSYSGTENIGQLLRNFSGCRSLRIPENSPTISENPISLNIDDGMWYEMFPGFSSDRGSCISLQCRRVVLSGQQLTGVDLFLFWKSLSACHEGNY